MINHDLLRSDFNSIDPVKQKEAINYWNDNLLPFPKPISVHFSITSRCGSMCQHCFQWQWPKQTELTYDSICKILFTLKSWGIKSITFGGGDPFLHSDFIKIIKLAKLYGFSISIITNCSIYDKKILKEIATYCDWIRFSIDGPKEIHNAIRNFNFYDNVKKSINYIKYLNSNIITALNFVIQKINFGYINDIFKVQCDLNADFMLLKVVHGEGEYMLTETEWSFIYNWLKSNHSMKQQKHTNINELIYCFDTFYTLHDLARGYPVHTYYFKHNILCFVPMFFLSISSNGNVYPCDYLQYDTRIYSDKQQHYILGNILNDPNVVLETRQKVYTNISHYPAKGFIECGSCTRFCLFNTIATNILRNNNIIKNESEVEQYVFL